MLRKLSFVRINLPTLFFGQKYLFPTTQRFYSNGNDNEDKLSKLISMIADTEKKIGRPQPVQDSESEHSDTDHACDHEHLEQEDDFDPDEFSHPVEDTGIEFRSYSVGDTSETPEINEDIGIEQEEGSEFQIDAKKKKKPKPFVHRDFTKCRGCGIRLQTENPAALGYYPPAKKTKRKRRICHRCYYLQYHNKEPPQIEKNVQIKYETGLSANIVSSYLKEVFPNTSCVVVHILDLNDLSSESILPQLTKVIGSNPLVFVANKVDLLPPGWKEPRIKAMLQKFITKQCNIPDFPLSHIHIVSSYSGQNVKMAIKEIDDFRAQRDIYIVGCVNSGKSSFINSALLHVGIGGVKYDKKFGLTTSNLPGTTLDAISLPLKTGGYMHDTPGFLVSNILPSLLALERKMLVPRKTIRPIIVFMREGKSILLGGCARLDFIRGSPMYFTLFISSTLTPHFTSISRADELFETQLGLYLQPPILQTTDPVELHYSKIEQQRAKEEERKQLMNMKKKKSNDPKQNKLKNRRATTETTADALDEDVQEGELQNSTSKRADQRPLVERLNEQRPCPLPPFKERTFSFVAAGDDFDEAWVDIVFPGVGTISVTGKNSYDGPVIMKASGFSTPWSRTSIMPFEANADMRKQRGYKKHGKLSNYKYYDENIPAESLKK